MSGAENILVNKSLASAQRNLGKSTEDGAYKASTKEMIK